MLGFAADALQVVEVAGRNAFEDLTHARHGDKRNAVLGTGRIQVCAKMLHELAPFGLSASSSAIFTTDNVANVLHESGAVSIGTY